MSIVAVTRTRRATVELVGTVFGSVCVLAALLIIWVARVSTARDVYVSELGARGEPTAKWFEAALLLIVLGGSLIAYAGRGIRSRLPVLRAWTPALSLWIGCAFFLVASQVPCTTGCPLPVGASFDWQDFAHTLVAVLAFGAACWAMLQISFASGQRALAVVSLSAGIAVAIIAGAGGIMSLARFQSDFGSRLELVATTIALGWLLVLGAVIAGRLAVGRVVASPQVPILVPVENPTADPEPAVPLADRLPRRQKLGATGV
ncbi:DUF998 domain-containing protein [Glaciihabitans sp. UYNi722]|uniref:DUF998 domain-containing protein n=1 Tax=Glaciihabitans sp. UYNi722 TaxID=3156344 RepID=UPI0033948E58